MKVFSKRGEKKSEHGKKPFFSLFLQKKYIKVSEKNQLIFLKELKIIKTKIPYDLY